MLCSEFICARNTSGICAVDRGDCIGTLCEDWGECINCQEQDKDDCEGLKGL